ncbi:MAG: hypothetical protein B6A08_12440 [Sorangiineae bacterium NIC37A_2]|nr:MAG: hypothetical protein B6A08_12440 [Sorangiineae bacterium NIC37A_2]
MVAGGKVDEREVPPEEGRARVRPELWISSTYFAEGFPYGIINSLAEILFRDMGASLAGVGLTSLFHLPWNFKFFWAPLMERTLSMRRWILLFEVALLGLFVAAGGIVFFREGFGPELTLVLLSVIFLVAAFASASHDVAIDAFYLEAQNEKEQARHVGLRSSAYKVASILVRGPGLALVAAVGWTLGLSAAAAVLAALALFHLRVLKRLEEAHGALPTGSARRKEPGAREKSSRRWLIWLFGCIALASLLMFLSYEVPAVRSALTGSTAMLVWSGLLVVGLTIGVLVSRRRLRNLRGEGAFSRLLSHPHFLVVLAFIVTFRLGESFLQKMKWPFLSEFVGLTKAEYGTLNGTIGVIVSFVGLIVGGRLIARDGLERWFWPFLLAQNALNLLYAALALVPDGLLSHELNLGVVGLVIVCEEFGAGLGASVLMVFLMRLCHGQHRASEFALLTAVMTIGFTISGALSGYVAEAVGYFGFFVASFVLTLPMMGLGPHALRRSHDFAPRAGSS